MSKICIFVIGSFLCAALLTIFITHAVIDPYIKLTNYHSNLVDFCKNDKEADKVYFIGDSFAVNGVSSDLINKTLHSQNISLNTYNIGYKADLPRWRIVELIPIVDSKPKMVVFCSAYRWFQNISLPDSYMEERFVADADNIKLNTYATSLFNNTQLSLLQPDPLQLIIFKKRFIIPALTSYPRKLDFYLKGGTTRYVNKTATKSDIDKASPIKLSSADNIDKKAFIYIVNYLKDRGVRVIIINMPTNPLFSEHKISNETREIYAEFIKQIGCPYYDLASLCSPNEFYDAQHPNMYGVLNISAKMAEIVAMEAKNVTA